MSLGIRINGDQMRTARNRPPDSALRGDAPPPTPVRAVVVGAGTIAGASHMPAVQALRDRVAVVGVVDVDDGRARDFAARWSVPVHGTDLRDVLGRCAPDLAIVCAPPAQHRELVTQCLDAGVDVWCEKPAGISLADLDAMSRHERPGGPYVSFVAQHRFGAGARRLREHLLSGELGRPLVALCNTMWFRPPEYFDVPWRGRWATEGGGPTLGHGIHQIDLALSLLGDWTEVRAMTGTLDRAIEVEDVSMAVVRLESGAMLSVVCSLLSPREESYLRFDLTDATVELSHVYGYDNHSWTWAPAPHVTDSERVRSWPPTDPGPSGHAAQLAHVLDRLTTGERPESSGTDARRTLELVTAIYRSARTGLPVRRTDLTTDDPFYHSLSGEHPGGTSMTTTSEGEG